MSDTNTPTNHPENNSSGGIWGYFLRSSHVTFVIITGLAIIGTWTMLTLPREASPEVKIPYGVVVTAYPGAASRDVEELVTERIEKKIKSLEGVKETESSSQMGISTVTVEFHAEEDLQESLRRLREAVDQISGFPDDAQDPQVVEISISDGPIISIGLGGLEDERLLTLYADEIAEKIENLPGVSQVNVVGSRKEQVVVRLNPERLAENRLSIGQVLAAIKAANVNMPFGQLTTDSFNYDLRFQGRFETVGDVAEIPIRLTSGAVIALGDLADISFELSELNSESRLSENLQPSTPAVSIQVSKKTGGNIVSIIDAINEEIAKERKTTLPPEVTVQSFADQGSYIRESLKGVTSSGAQTLAIVFVVLWLFLGWQEALIAALSIPLTFFISFIVFESTGITLNDISLFSLILALGMLVDNAIVVTEGIHTGIGRPNLREHAIRVVNSFTKPLIGGVLTTVAAFFPLLLVGGIMGEFLRTIPIVVSATLLSSLIVALAFIPAVAVSTLEKFKQKHRERWFDQKFAQFKASYGNFITWVLHHRKLQNWTMGVMIALLVVGLSLPFTGLIKTGLFPAVDVDFLTINIKLPAGSALEETAKIADQVEDQVRKVSEATGFVANIGSGSSMGFGGGSSSENLASFYINLNKERKRSSIEITKELRQKMAAITDAQVIVEDTEAGPPSSSPVEMKVSGLDLVELDALSQKVVDELKTVPGAINVDRNIENSAGSFTFTFNQAELSRLGMTSTDVAQFLRSAIYGIEATTFLNEAGEEVKVSIEAPENTVDSISKILSLPMVTTSGERIVLGQVAQVQLNSSIETIRHRDGDRTITVTAKTNGTLTANDITAEMQKRVATMEIPQGYKVTFGGEQQETNETFADMYRSMIIAVILILFLLIIEFNSYRQSLLIFWSIPLALIGVLFGLLVFGGILNFAAFIGLVSLTGIVVNNAILLIDRMNILRGKGVAPEEAAARAAESRLRPILLTTLTTVAGVLPLIWSDEFFRDMALTLATGLTFSTIITLVYVPMLYVRQENKLIAKQQARAIKNR